MLSGRSGICRKDGESTARLSRAKSLCLRGGDPFLRVAAHEDLTGATGDGGKPEAGASADAHHGAKGHLPGYPHQSDGAGASNLSLSIGKGCHQSAQPCLNRRHHLPAHVPGLPLPGGNHGLAQPCSRSGWRDAPFVPPPHRITMQESRGLGALTGCPATSRRWWYLPYAEEGRDLGL